MILLHRSRDADKGKIDFVDIASPSYNPDDNQGLSYQQVSQMALDYLCLSLGGASCVRVTVSLLLASQTLAVIDYAGIVGVCKC